MSRFSKQSWHQRAIDAEARVRDLEKQLHRESRAHAATRLRADRADVLERRIVSLELDVQLGASDEVRRLEALVGELQEQLGEVRAK